MSMTLRDKINRNPKQAGIIGGSLIFLALVFIFWYNCGGSGGAGSGRSYYSIDDGKTFFEDASNKIPPFTHEGKQAARAHVFRCGSSEPFVGYLEMYTPNDKKVMEDALAGKAPPAAYAGFSGQAMVKKPGAQYQWIALMPGTTQFYAQTVQQAPCPDGTQPERVYPD